MKQTFIIISILTIAVIYFSCKSNTTSPTGPTPLTSISGTIENWTQGVQTLKLVSNTVAMYPIVLASTQISATGSFNINFPSSVIDSLLYETKFVNDTNCSGNVVVNPTNLKAMEPSFGVYQNDSIIIGSLSNGSDTLAVTGSTYIYYIYFNATGTIKGNYSCNYISSMMSETFDMNFSQGWNAYSVKYTLLTPTNTTVTISSTIPTGMKWYYHSYWDTPEKERHFLLK